MNRPTNRSAGRSGWRGAARTRLARFTSIVGHPALLMPIAVAIAAVQRGAAPGVARGAMLAALAVGTAALLYSLRQVRSGSWTHIDASRPAERLQLNTVLGGLLLGAAALLAVLSRPRPLVVGLGLGGALVLLAVLLRNSLKLSLHVGFALFAAGLVWPRPWPLAACLAMAAAVAWSRLVLGRHVPRDVIVAALAGLAAGVTFQVLAGAR